MSIDPDWIAGAVLALVLALLAVAAVVADRAARDNADWQKGYRIWKLIEALGRHSDLTPAEIALVMLRGWDGPDCTIPEELRRMGLAANVEPEAHGGTAT